MTRTYKGSVRLWSKFLNLTLVILTKKGIFEDENDENDLINNANE